MLPSLVLEKFEQVPSVHHSGAAGTDDLSIVESLSEDITGMSLVTVTASIMITDGMRFFSGIPGIRKRSS